MLAAHALRPAALSLALCVAPGLTSRAQTCPIVDRGAPADGVTTIQVIEPETECTERDFEGWRCIALRSAANDNGVSYDVDVRWNRAALPTRASVVWLGGGDGATHLRHESPLVKALQDEIDRFEYVRTIELRLRDLGYAAPPRNGFANLSAVLADVLEHLHAEGLLIGAVGALGNSAGSEMVANTLAYHRGDELLDAAFLVSGPFFTDLHAICADPVSPIFGGTLQRKQVDDRNYVDFGATPCLGQSLTPDPEYRCRSLLGDEAALSLATELHIAVGTLEDPWVIASAAYYFQSVAAPVASYTVAEGPHALLDEPAGASWATERVISLAAATPKLCTADLNGDAIVNLSDLGILVANFGATNAERAQGDLNADGVVELTDLGTLLAEYGGACL